MKRYLLLGTIYGRIVMIDEITKQHLIDLKARMFDSLIDTQNGTFFDVDANDWVKIDTIND